MKIQISNTKSQQNGITLVSLVITIIILLVIAGVAINMALDSEGLFSKANEAVTKWNASGEEDDGILKNLLEKMNEINTENTPPNTKVTISAGQRATVNSEYTDGINTAIIPAGFTVSGLSGENVIEEGLVIYLIPDGTTVDWENAEAVETAQTTYDQFVWIPMPKDNINEMYMCQSEDGTKSCKITVKEINGEDVAYCTTHSSTLMAGRLYIQESNYVPTLTTQAYSNTEREPDIVSYDNGGYLGHLNSILKTTYGSGEEFKADLQNEYNDIVKSVYKNEGFYVGRYETSNVTKQSGDAVNVIAGTIPSSYINWYKLYAQQKEYATNKNLNVGSTMIQGAAYDQIMKFVNTSSYNVNTYGNVGHMEGDVTFSTQPYETGGRDYSTSYSGTVSYKDVSKNIYDLEGNVPVLCVGRHSSYERILRGGTLRSNTKASRTSGNEPNQYLDYSHGSILQLYIVDKQNKKEEVKELDTKYFSFTYDDNQKTAIITGIQTNYLPNGTNSYIQDSEIKINKLLIPSSVVKNDTTYTINGIGANAFKMNDGQTSEFTIVQLPDSITTIGEYAFYGCSNISYINLPENVTSIGTSAFQFCSKLDLVLYLNDEYLNQSFITNTLEDNGATVGESAFADTALEESCIAEGTLITLSNGEQVPVENLTGEEKLLVWNLEIGKYEEAPIAYIINHGKESSKKEIIHMFFSDGTDIKIIKDHGFYDLDLNKYVYIDATNYKEYIGHWFVKQALGERWEKTQLINVKIEEIETVAYEVVTYKNLTCFTNGLLSISSLLNPFCNTFAVDKNTLSYDKELMAKDIEKYGLFTYDDFEGLIPEYAFELYHVDYLKIALGKGQTTWKEIEFLIEYYNKEIEQLVK